MIETERLELRTLKLSDLESLNELFSDPEVMNSSLNGTKTPGEVKAWLVSQIEKNTIGHGIELFAVKCKSTAEIIGYCGLTEYPDIDGANEIEIGYRLIRRYWSLGYATEAATAVRDYAFTELNLVRLIALIEPVNQRSVGVAKRIGMSYEKDVMLEGYDHPDHLYSMKNYGQA